MKPLGTLLENHEKTELCSISNVMLPQGYPYEHHHQHAQVQVHVEHQVEAALYDKTYPYISEPTRQLPSPLSVCNLASTSAIDK